TELDPDLLFQLLAVADGFVPTRTVRRVDPRAGPVTLPLRLHDLDRRTPELIVRGLVVDHEGNPVAGAEVWPFALQKGDSTQFGGLTGVDALAVTNAAGEFRLGVADKGAALHVQVEARNFARRKFASLQAGLASHRLQLGPGVSVLGKVVKGRQAGAGCGDRHGTHQSRCGEVPRRSKNPHR
ncbi:MAG TPA: hypothetical protein VGY66_05430, partial [Gemmataceae bacterium]|nr:hypothetical protein [Gemmataceae bacterium]